MLVNLRIATIPRLRLGLSACAKVPAEVQARSSASMNRQTRLLPGVTKRSTVSTGSVPLYPCIGRLGMNHFGQVFPRLSSFPIRTNSCTPSQIGCIEQRRRTLSIGTVPARAVDVFGDGTTLSFSISCLGAFRVLCPDLGELAGGIRVLSRVNSPDLAGFRVLL